MKLYHGIATPTKSEPFSWCWYVDLEKKEIVANVEFLWYMKQSKGVEPEVVGILIKEVMYEKIKANTKI